MEATIVLPVYILLLVFMINFLNIFYLKMTVQSGLNNVGTTMAQYCYAIDLLLDGGMSSFTLTDGTSEKVGNIQSNVDNLMSTAGSTMTAFDQPLSLDTLISLIDNGKAFADAVKSTGNALMSVTGDDVKHYLFTVGAEAGGSLIVKTMVERYLDDMKVNRNLIDGDIAYEMYIDPKTEDLIFVARYLYKNDMFRIFMNKPFYVEQQVVVHPWVGGETKSLRGK